jgi:hypothetical protein
VAEEFLHDLGMNAPAQRVGRCSVPEVVDPDSRQRGLIEGSMKGEITCETISRSPLLWESITSQDDRPSDRLHSPLRPAWGL